MVARGRATVTILWSDDPLIGERLAAGGRGVRVDVEGSAAVVAFAPSFVFVLIGGGQFERIRSSARAQAFLAGAGPAAIGAILVGLLESYAAFWSSAFKEVLVFGALIPVLIWQSLRASGGVEEEIEDEDHERDA